MERAEFWDAVVIAAVVSGQWQGKSAVELARQLSEARDGSTRARDAMDDMGDKHGECLQRIGSILDLPAGANLHVDIEARVCDALDLLERIARMLSLSPTAEGEAIMQALSVLKSRAQAVGQAAGGYQPVPPPRRL